ncbi:MAG: family 16 glycoside hydrolase [Fibrobacteria bacterium]
MHVIRDFYFGAALLLCVGGSLAQSFDLRGRVLDPANGQGVPGALVKVAGSSITALTDSAGRFTVADAGAGLGAVRRAPAEPYFHAGALFIEAIEPGQSAGLQIFGAGGERIASTLQELQPGWNRVDPAPRAGDFIGFARIHVGGVTWIKSFLHTAAPVSGSWFAGIATNPYSPGRGLAKAAKAGKSAQGAKAAKPAVAGQVEITVDKLARKTVSFASETADLGDIVMDYPARKPGVGAEPIYGATVLFDGRRGKAAAAAELAAKWQDWPRFTPSAIPMFKIASDPEFLSDTNRASLQACCNTLWGYDDIQAKVGLFADFQAHVEFICMGEYDSPLDLATPDANSAAAYATESDPGYSNSGVYAASRYEIQIQSWSTDASKPPSLHDMGAIVDAYAPASNRNKANGVWQAYDITYRNARFIDTIMATNPRMSVWWNGVQVHDNRLLNAGASGLDNHSGEEHSDQRLYGLKLQSEGRDVRFRNIWIKELKIAEPQTNFGY